MKSEEEEKESEGDDAFDWGAVSGSEKEEDEDKVEELGGDEEENERHDVRIWRAE